MELPLMTIPRRDSRGWWDLGEAVSRQRRLRERVIAEDRLGPVHRPHITVDALRSAAGRP